MIKRIIEAYLKAKETYKTVPKAYKPSPMWRSFLTLRQPLIEAMNNRDEEATTKLLSNLFRSSITAYTTFLRFWDAVRDDDQDGIDDLIAWGEYEIKAWKFYSDKDYKFDELVLPQIGNPYGYTVNGIRILPATPRYHYYSQKIKALLHGIDNPLVAEIGGGVGLMAYFLTRDSHIKYVEFDLPEVLATSQYYLMSAFPDKKFLLYGEQPVDEINSCLINQYDYILMPHFELPKLADGIVDVFHNCHSLSEMDRETIDEYIKHIARTTNGYFYHENSGYGLVKVVGEFDENSATQFNVPEDKFVRLYMMKSIWGETVYYEYLYKKI